MTRRNIAIPPSPGTSRIISHRSPLIAMRSLASIPRGYIWVAAIAVGVILLGWWVWASFFETYHLAQVDGVLYRDGFRTFREFQTSTGKTHVKQVVCLLDDAELKKEPFNLEEEYCRRSRIAF